ncbi:MAG: glycosyltransferase family 4 protein [Candidatus Omnitrophica bacterium]|nr:glycosyltransferase family 4 protein [Candidatus Omnitrophota bacterium]MDD5081486.1 glycosyltransferase family 4 protein [Candidatus Omnitrophota bacterium]MDD5440794.1 glycosyltransferase family 4 protein [Candidatus Omnitrophota bacterium]
MKILLLANHLKPGGISRYCLSLGAGLNRLGHKVFLATSGGAWCRLCAAAGIEHITVPLTTKSILSLKVIRTSFILRRFIKENGIQIVHANTRVTQMAAFLLSKICRVPYIVTFHGFYRPHFFRKVFPLAGKYCIAVSNAVRDHMIKDFGIVTEKITTVYNGIDPAPKDNVSFNKQSINLKTDDFVVGMLGRISIEKGHFLAFDAMSLLWKDERYASVKFLISGEGKLKDSFLHYVRENGFSDRVIIINEPAGISLKIMDIMLMPSSKEGFGYSVLEAFMNDVAVIGYNIGGIAEIIEDGVSGLLFSEYTPESLAEKIKTLIDDSQLRVKLSIGALSRLRKFSQNDMAVNTYNVYEEAF